MLPTGVGVITVFFVVSEFVPGGPLDQVEAMIIQQANEAGMGDSAMIGDDSSVGAVKIDPEMRMQIKRKLGLNHNSIERYLRMLLWCSPDSLISSIELPDGQSRKITFKDRRYIIFRKDNQYYLYLNKYNIDGTAGEIRFNTENKVFTSILNPEIKFNPETGKEIGGTGVLNKIPITVKKETFTEYEYNADGSKEKTKETRDEVYIKSTFMGSLLNWSNWHGMFLLKFPNSITQNKKCFTLIMERLPVSMRLGIISFFITYTMCLIMGISKAAKNGSVYDSTTSVVILIGFGIPGFLLAIFLLKAFGPSGDSWVHLIPLKGIHSPAHIYNTLGFWAKLWDNIHHLIAPIMCLTIGSFAGLTILTKNSILEEMHQLYAVAARARGLSKRKVLFKHVLRNSLIPLVTGFPARFVMMFFAGSLLIEKIFSLDGIGLLSFTALIQRDYPLIISNMFIFTYIGLLCRLLSDIGYVIVDPRISFEGKKS